MNDRPAAGCCG